MNKEFGIAGVKLVADKKNEADRLNKASYEIRNIDQEQSRKTAEEALKVSEDLGYDKGKAEALSNIGFYNLQKGHHEKAYQQLMDALTVFEKLDDEQGIANVLYNIGIVHLRIGNFDNAIAALQKSLGMREVLGDTAGRAACHFQLSYIHQYFDDWDSSKEHAEKSRELRKEIKDVAGEAAALMVLSDTYLKKQDYKTAKELLLESIRLRENTEEKLGYFATKIRWAEINIQIGEVEEARQSLNEGLEAAKKEGILFGVIRFLQTIGKLGLVENNAEAAKEAYLKALEYSGRSTFKSIEYELHEALAETYRRLNDMEAAFKHYKEFHRLKEEVISLQSNTRLKSVQYINQLQSAKREAGLEKEKNTELKKAYDIIEEKNKDITDSIHYARRIQNAILPKDELINSLFPESFVLYKPKDIVSGDFYWVGEKNGKKIIAAADCTGHGIPGAFMSMMGSALLNEIINEKGITSSAQILNHLRERVMQTLQQTGADGESKDGMDIALCVIGENSIEFSGANNPLYVVRNNELKEYKSDKQPIGVHAGNEKPFSGHQIDVQKGDMLYIFSDGYVDQFGGPDGKKFMSRRFRELLISVSKMAVNQQKNMLNDTIENWRQGGRQIDDILVIGVKM